MPMLPDPLGNAGFFPLRNRADQDSGQYDENKLWSRAFDKFIKEHTPQTRFGFAPGAGVGAGGPAGVPQATVLPETIAPVAQGTSTAGLGLAPGTVGLGGAGGAAGSFAVSGSSAPWMGIAKGAVTGLSAYQQAVENRKAAEAAAKGGSVTRTPYMANMLNPFIPYILQEALNIYSKRQSNIGRKVGDFNPLQAILGQFFQNYTSQK